MNTGKDSVLKRDILVPGYCRKVFNTFTHWWFLYRERYWYVEKEKVNIVGKETSIPRIPFLSVEEEE